jgi:hypothetical protein
MLNFGRILKHLKISKITEKKLSKLKISSRSINLSKIYQARPPVFHAKMSEPSRCGV